MCANHSHHEHSHIHLPSSMVTRRSALRIGGIGIGAALLAACSKSQESAPTTSLTEATTTTTSTVVSTSAVISTLAGFEYFADSVKVVNNGNLWLVESNGLPAHNMMVGITAWQQQVPLPQPYRGDNAWRIPLRPVPAPNGGVTIRDRFLRGHGHRQRHDESGPHQGEGGCAGEN